MYLDKPALNVISSTPKNAISRLPKETWDEIMDCLHANPGRTLDDVRNCVLVCKTWFDRGQRNLHSTHRFTNWTFKEKLERFREHYLNNDTELKAYITHLDISLRYTLVDSATIDGRLWTTVSPWALQLKSLELRFGQLTLPRAPTEPPTFPKLVFLSITQTRLHTISTLTSFLGYLPLLEHLHCEGDMIDEKNTKGGDGEDEDGGDEDSGGEGNLKAHPPPPGGQRWPPRLRVLRVYSDLGFFQALGSWVMEVRADTIEELEWTWFICSPEHPYMAAQVEFFRFLGPRLRSLSVCIDYIEEHGVKYPGPFEDKFTTHETWTPEEEVVVDAPHEHIVFTGLDLSRLTDIEKIRVSCHPNCRHLSPLWLRRTIESLNSNIVDTIQIVLAGIDEPWEELRRMIAHGEFHRLDLLLEEPRFASVRNIEFLFACLTAREIEQQRRVPRENFYEVEVPVYLGKDFKLHFPRTHAKGRRVKMTAFMDHELETCLCYEPYIIAPRPGEDFSPVVTSA